MENMIKTGILAEGVCSDYVIYSATMSSSVSLVQSLLCQYISYLTRLPASI